MNQRLSITILLFTALCNSLALAQEYSASSKFCDVKDDGNSVAIQAGNENFCRYEYRKFEKPILYPIKLRDNLNMTRSYPMKKISGEANDHPHHMSMWMGHEISGLDFWKGKTGKIRFKEITSLSREKGTFTVVNEWIRKSNQEILLEETTQYHFGYDSSSRWIYADVRFHAKQDVTFDDTKEGLFAIRTHPQLRLSPDPRRGVEKVTGKAISDSGVTGKAVWGKPAKWLDYHGKIDGQSVGISLFDHPSNLRHPTTWHAREYGLIAANPFGLHYFAKAPKGAGNYPLNKGKVLNLKYGIRFYRGDFEKQKTESAFEHFVNQMN